MSTPKRKREALRYMSSEANRAVRPIPKPRPLHTLTPGKTLDNGRKRFKDSPQHDIRGSVKIKLRRSDACSTTATTNTTTTTTTTNTTDTAMAIRDNDILSTKDGKENIRGTRSPLKPSRKAPPPPVTRPHFDPRFASGGYKKSRRKMRTTAPLTDPRALRRRPCPTPRRPLAYSFDLDGLAEYDTTTIFKAWANSTDSDGSTNTDQPEVIALKKLKSWRTSYAATQSLPEYMILNDSVLQSIAQELPNSVSTLLDIKGMTAMKAHDLSKEVLGVVRTVRKDAKMENPESIFQLCSKCGIGRMRFQVATKAKGGKIVHNPQANVSLYCNFSSCGDTVKLKTDGTEVEGWLSKLGRRASFKGLRRSRLSVRK